MLHKVDSVNVNTQTYSSSSTVVQRKLEVSTFGITICACSLRPEIQRCHAVGRRVVLLAAMCCRLRLAITVQFSDLTAKHCMKECISSIHSRFFLPLLLTLRGTCPVPMLSDR